MQTNITAEIPVPDSLPDCLAQAELETRNSKSMCGIFKHYVALTRNLQFDDINANGDAVFNLSKGDYENFPLLSCFTSLTVKCWGLRGYSVELA